MPKLSLIIPMYNESSIIRENADILCRALIKDFGPGNYELIFVDDGSRDDCAEIVKSLELPGTRVIRYETNRGKGYAVRTGMLAATGEIAMFTDADLAYGTDVVKQVADEFDAHPETDLIIGSRNLSKDGYMGYSAFRKIASKTYIRILCTMGGFKLSDSQCGCKAFRLDAAKKIFSRCEVDRFAFDFECILWAGKYGMQIREIPVKIINHRASTVHVFRDSVRMMGDLRRMKKRIRRAEIGPEETR
ncbi:MAG: glycosyltransferase [Clostridia bacterium]|nr:glycosyltransferase [Clostridia bacterium]